MIIFYTTPTNQNLGNPILQGYILAQPLKAEFIVGCGVGCDRGVGYGHGVGCAFGSAFGCAFGNAFVDEI